MDDDFEIGRGQDSLTIEFEITKETYIAATKSLLWQRLLILATCFLVIAAASYSLHAESVFVLTLAIGGPIICAVAFLVQPRLLWRKQKQIHGDGSVRLRLDESVFEVETPVSSARNSWSEFGKLSRFSGGYVLRFRRLSTGYIVSDSAFNSDEERSQFETLVKSYIGRS